MRTEKLSRGRSDELVCQVKHGNISFLLTQESGSYLYEVAFLFSREPPAIRSSHVKLMKKSTDVQQYLVMNPELSQIMWFVKSWLADLCSNHILHCVSSCLFASYVLAGMTSWKPCCGGLRPALWNSWYISAYTGLLIVFDDSVATDYFFKVALTAFSATWGQQ